MVLEVVVLKKRKHLDFEFTESQPLPDNDENSSNDEVINF